MNERTNLTSCATKELKESLANFNTSFPIDWQDVEKERKAGHWAPPRAFMPYGDPGSQLDLLESSLGYSGNKPHFVSPNPELQQTYADSMQADRRQLQEAVLTSPEFQQALPPLALEYLKENFSQIHDSRTGDGITLDELKKYRQSLPADDQLHAAFADYFLQKDDSGGYQRFESIRNENGHDSAARWSLGIGVHNAPGISSQDIERRLQSLKTMFASQSKRPGQG